MHPCLSVPDRNRLNPIRSNRWDYTLNSAVPLWLTNKICRIFLLSCYHFYQLFTDCVLLSSIPPLSSCVGGFKYAVCGCYLALFHLMQPSLSVRSRSFKATPSFHWVPSGKWLSGSYLRELLPAPRGQYAPASHSHALRLSPRGELDTNETGEKGAKAFFMRYSTKCYKIHL